MPIPLDTALSLLGDTQGDINLDVPLSGPVSELNVGVACGALASVGMKAGENMLQVKLPPVVFAQQEKTVNDEHPPYLERIVPRAIYRFVPGWPPGSL